MATQDGYVQQPVDGTGKRVRTYEVLQIVADGTAQLVELQGVVVLDTEGNPVDYRAQTKLLTEIRELLQALVEKD